MRQITEYMLIDVSRVNEFIEAGWQPFGSPQVIKYPGGHEFRQAVVKYYGWPVK